MNKRKNTHSSISDDDTQKIISNTSEMEPLLIADTHNPSIISSNHVNTTTLLSDTNKPFKKNKKSRLNQTNENKFVNFEELIFDDDFEEEM